MAYFPFMMDICNKSCLIVGGGKIALHKANILLGFEANIVVVSPVFEKEFFPWKRGRSEFIYGNVSFWNRIWTGWILQLQRQEAKN